jgi:hypothetical protein
MINRFFFFLLTFCSATSYAQQFAYEFWHEGKAVLESNDTLRGFVKYDLQNDIIQVKAANQLQSFTARKVLFVEIFDASVKRYRQFYSLPYSPNNTYKSPKFFELLCEGKITLLSRENIELRTYNSNFSYYGTVTQQVMVYKYYLLKPNGAIEDFVGKKSDWLRLMDNKEKDVRDFAKDNRLDFEEKYELIRIIDYYNSLAKK